MDINYDGDLSKTRTCFRKNTYVFLENYVRVFGKTRTCFLKITYVFLEKHVHVFEKTRTCFLKITYVFLEKHDRVKNSQVKYTVSYLFSRVHFMVTHPLLVEG